MIQWIEDLKYGNTVYDVARRLGLDGGPNRSFGPCPACGAEKRGGEDRRKPCGADGEGKGWHCWACSEKGDAIDILSLSVHKRKTKDLDAEAWEHLRQQAVRLGMVSDTGEPRGAGERPQARAKIPSVAQLIGERVRPAAQPQQVQTARPEREPSGPVENKRFSWSQELAGRCADALWTKDKYSEIALAYLNRYRALAQDSIRVFKLGIYVDPEGKPVLSDAGRPYITIPLFDRQGRVVNVRFRSVPIPGTCQECKDHNGCRKCKEYRVCTGRPLPLYGAHLLTADRSCPVIVTEGELDVIALYSYGFQVNVVSGTAGAGTWADEWLDELEPYDSIIGLYDADEKGNEGWKGASLKLGTYRCARAILPVKDANEALIKGIEASVIERAIAQAKPTCGIEFKTVDRFSEQLEELISNPDKLKGATTGSPKLDTMIGGWRPGIVVVTGETNQGKSTFATWALYQQAKMGVPVALSSFEQEPIGTVQKLLRMEVGQDFTRISREERIAALQRVGDLPLHILDHYGQITPEKMIETMRYGQRRLGIRMFLIDHLGFLLDPESKDERLTIQAVVRALAIIAKQMGIVIFLVVHPSNTMKEIPGKYARVTMRDLKGASAIRQDADDVLVIVRELPNMARGQRCKRAWPQTRIHADKVRSEFGQAGAECVLAYDTGACIYADDWDQTPAGKAGWLVPHERSYKPEDDGKDEDEAPIEKPKRRQSRSKKTGEENIDG